MAFNWQASMVAGEHHKQVFPAAERNKEPILGVLKQHLRIQQGLVLEVASGTGQHIACFASELSPQLTWLPTDLTPELFPSVVAHTAGMLNVRRPELLDASAPGSWPVNEPLAAVLVANMTHIAPWEATLGLLEGAGRHLLPGGQLFIYGPFKVDGRHTTDSNAQFDAQLRATNPAWGYRDQGDVAAAAAPHGLKLEAVLPMPANNYTLVFAKEG